MLADSFGELLQKRLQRLHGCLNEIAHRVDDVVKHVQQVGVPGAGDALGANRAHWLGVPDAWACQHRRRVSGYWVTP